MRIFKSKIFWFLIVLTLSGGTGAYFYFNTEPKVEYVTQAAVRDTLYQTVSATGQIKSASEIDLNFKKAGQLVALNVETGNSVLKDDVVAELKSTDIKINISKAQADLQEAQANLNKVIAGATDQEIKVAQAAVDKAKIDLSNAMDSLESTKATYNQALQNSRQSLLIDINASLTKATIALSFIDDSFEFKGDEVNFSTSNFGLENKVKSEQTIAVSQVSAADNLYDGAVAGGADYDMSGTALSALDAMGKTKIAINDFRELLNYLTFNTVLTQSESETLKTNADTQRTTIDSSIGVLQDAYQDFLDADLSYATQVQDAENDILAAQKILDKAQADLDLKKAPARSEDIALHQAKVRRAQAGLQEIQDQLTDTILVSPIDGTITAVNYEVGEQTSLSEPVTTLVAVGSNEIEVDIPESDIAKIELGNMATITLDAFSDEDIFNGSIITIDPAQTEIQDVIYYKVTVAFNIEQPADVLDLIDKIKPGMTANITFATDSREDVVVIPYRAIKEIDGQKIVQVLEEGVARDVVVTTGLRGNEGLVEIINGLKAGQEVVVFVRDN